MSLVEGLQKVVASGDRGDRDGSAAMQVVELLRRASTGEPRGDDECLTARYDSWPLLSGACPS
jgi:hypothetical protein